MSESIVSSSEADLADMFRERLQTIARGELQRRRKQLGLMTAEQELALDQLVNSTVERISDPLVQRLRQYYAAGEVKRAWAWISIFN